MPSPWEQFKQELNNLKTEFPEFSQPLEEIENIQEENYQETVAELKRVQAAKRAAREQQ
jgi:hypothetical protein